MKAKFGSIIGVRMSLNKDGVTGNLCVDCLRVLSDIQHFGKNRASFLGRKIASMLRLLARQAQVSRLENRSICCGLHLCFEAQKTKQASRDGRKNFARFKREACYLGV